MPFKYLVVHEKCCVFVMETIVCHVYLDTVSVTLIVLV